MRVPMLAYVDDLVLLADSAADLQRALDIVHRWARRIRMRLNIGPTKSAVLRAGRGRIRAVDRNFVHRLGDRALPRVS